MSSESPSPINPDQAQDVVDDLLEAYLFLVDEYTLARHGLQRAQMSLYQDLARANFTAERGRRYGPDDFDERMKATLRLAVRPLRMKAANDTMFECEREDTPSPVRDVLDTTPTMAALAMVKADLYDALKDLHVCRLQDASTKPTSPREDEEETQGTIEKDQETTREESLPLEREPTTDERPVTNESPPNDENTSTALINDKSQDPLRWFGLLVPPALRSAQARAREAVEAAVKLSSLAKQMRAVEDRIHRERTHRQQQQAPASTIGDKAESGLASLQPLRDSLPT